MSSYQTAGHLLGPTWLPALLFVGMRLTAYDDAAAG